LQLPEIENAKITEVLDVSPAYIFYDETQPDSTLLNRKNLISTTNWLVNVDKRLTLRQAIPHIKFLQDKKRNAELHKNENAKNYFTCNDTTIGNLGFLEFTDVYYIIEIDSYTNDEPINNEIRSLSIHFFSNGYFSLTELFDGKQSRSEILNINTDFDIDFFKIYRENKNSLHLSFDEKLRFQDYIKLKNNVLLFTNEMSEIDANEFIY